VSGYTTVALSDLLAPVTVKDSAGNFLAQFTTGGAFQLRGATPAIQWATAASPNPTNCLNLQPYGTNQNANIVVAPSGTATGCCFILFPSSTVANGQPNLNIGCNSSNERASTWCLNSNIYASVNALSYDLGLMVSNVANGRMECLTVQASTGSVGINNTTPGSEQLSVVARTATTIGAVVQAAASASANIQEWQDSSNNVLASVDPVGTLQGRYLALSGAGTPGVTVLAAAGTGATASMVAGSTDTRGTINLTTGTGATGGDQLTFTFATARPSAVYYVLTSFAGNFQGATFTAKGKSTTAFTLASSGLTASTAYQIDYLVIL
jgi:hypothetical protein